MSSSPVIDAEGPEIGFTLEPRHFPGFVTVRGRRLDVVKALL